MPWQPTDKQAIAAQKLAESTAKRVDDLSAEVDSKIGDVTQQLADTAKKNEIRESTAVRPINVSEMDTETKQLFTGGAVAVVGAKAVGKENIKERAVTSAKFADSIPTRNLFNGDYINGILFQSGDRTLLYPRNNYDAFLGKIGIIPLEANETYTVSFPESGHSHLRIGIHSSIPSFTDTNATPLSTTVYSPLNTGPVPSKYTFTNTASGKYALIYVSNAGVEPKMQVEKGTVATEYVPHRLLSLSAIEPIPLPDTRSSVATIIEDPATGYAPRPDGLSVVWIGPNEPTQAEPYDEWRQTEGFTYFVDFSKVDSSYITSNWTDVLTPFVSKTLVDGSLQLVSPPVNQNVGIVWSEVPPELDNEIYFKGKFISSTISGQALSTMHRFVSGEGVWGFVFAGLFGSVNFRVARKRPIDSSAVELARVPHNININNPYHQISRIDGNRIRAKVWQDGTKEPKEWLVDVIDPSILSESTGVGFYNFNGDKTMSISVVGVGTGGMRAPHRKVM